MFWYQIYVQDQNITHWLSYLSPVGNVAVFDSHNDVINVFPGSSVSDWNLALNTWNTTRDSKDAGRREGMAEKARTAQNPRHPVKGKYADLDMMELDTINLEEVGMDEGLTIYENIWEASASDHSINMNHAFHVGLFLKYTRRRQDKAVELWGNLCRDVLADQVRVDEKILYTNLRLADIEAQGVSHFPERK